MAVWKGSLLLRDGKKINHLELSTQDGDHGFPALAEGPLEMLAIVHADRIPLHLVAGPSLLVETSSSTAKGWLSGVLLHGELGCEQQQQQQQAEAQDDVSHASWLDTAQLQSPLAILAKAPPPPPIDASDDPRITELLFYAAKVASEGDSSPAPPTASSADSQDERMTKSVKHTEHHKQMSIRIFALPLSSDLLYLPALHSIPDDDAEMVFADQGQLLRSAYEIKREAQISKKRERLDDIFDTAPDRKRKARRLQAEAIQQAHSAPTAFDGRPIKLEDPSHTSSFPIEVSARSKLSAHARKLSRSMSVAERRPSSSRDTPEFKRPGATHAPTDVFEDSSVEAKNKHLVSKVVLAGMRIYGLQQRKTWPKGESQADADTERGDEEFKGVYHQTYKGVLFALRHKVSSQILETECIRDLADRLLHIFCNEPP